MEARAHNIDSSLKELNGAAYVSVNKGLVTRSSAVIPIIAQYLGVLFKIMKAKGAHEGCIEQMERLFAERLYTADKKVPVDSENRIRIDDWEEIDSCWGEYYEDAEDLIEEVIKEHGLQPKDAA